MRLYTAGMVCFLLAGCGLAPVGGSPKDTTDSGTPADLELAAELDFGSVDVGDVKTEALSLRNNTDEPIAVLAAAISGDSNFDFDVATAFPLEAEASGESVIVLTFSPDAEQSYEGLLSLTVQGEPDPVTVTLLGVGGEGGGDDGGSGGGSGGDDGPSAAVTVTPSSIDYGSVYTNATDVTSVTITNNEPNDILVTGLEFSAPLAFTWQAAAGESFTLAQVVSAGDSKTIDVYFQPAEERSYSETLTVETDAGDVVVRLTGVGEEPPCNICQPDLQVTTNGADDYSMELVGLGTAQGNITLRNASDVDLTLTAVNLVNDSAQGDFTISGISPQTLGPGSSVTGTISYTCVSAEFGLCIEGPDIIFGTNTNTVTFESDDPFESSYQVGMTAAVYPF